MTKIKEVPVAVAGVLEALIALALVLGLIDETVGGALSGMVAAGLALVYRIVTPVAKVAQILSVPVDTADRMLRKVRL